jgi:Ser/Thr protein kinase RdoA (MazF antagonist)
VEFELSILDFLEKKDFPSPRIVPDNRKRFYNSFKNKPSVLLHYIPGRMLNDITMEQMNNIGSQVGILHMILVNFKQPIERVTWEPYDICELIELESENIIKKRYPDAENFVTYIEKEFQDISFPDNLPSGITHQDIKPENIIIDQKGHISFIDFNDCYRGTLLFDVMTTAVWSCFKNGVLDVDLFKTYLNGYMKERPFTRNEKEYCFQALLFRLLRESFVWSMRFSPKVALKKSNNFLKCYKDLKKHITKYEKILES